MQESMISFIYEDKVYQVISRVLFLDRGLFLALRTMKNEYLFISSRLNIRSISGFEWPRPVPISSVNIIGIDIPKVLFILFSL